MPNKNIPEIIWTQIRSMYGSGLFVSLADLHKASKKIYGKNCPTPSAITARSAAEHWKKTTHQERLEAAQEKNYQELFAAEGLGKPEIVKLIKDGILHAEAVINRLISSINITTTKKGSAKIALTEQSADIIKEYTESLKIRQRYISERNKLTGDYAAVKIRPTRGGGGGAGSEDEMSLDEMLAERERLQILLSQSQCKP